MTMKNRVIRADDKLWARVTLRALALKRSVPEYVRQVLWRATEDKKCFYCGAPARCEQWVDVTKSNDLSLERAIALMAGGREVPETYSPVKITFCACAEHENQAADFFLDRDLGCSGYSLANTDHEPAAVHSAMSPPNSPAYVAMRDAIQNFAAATRAE